MDQSGRESAPHRGRFGTGRFRNGIYKALNVVKDFGDSGEQGSASLIKEYKSGKEETMENS